MCWAGALYGEPFALPSFLTQCRHRNLSQSQAMWQPLSFFQIMSSESIIMWSPPFYHWPRHHRIYTIMLLLKLGNFLLSRSLEEFAYWFRSLLVPIPSAMRRPPSPKSCLLCSLLHSRVWFCCSRCKPLFLACPHLSMSFLTPDTVMLYRFNIPKPLVMWLCQVCLIFLFI